MGGDQPDRVRAPDEAFEAVGNATRIDILRTLAAADEPVAFSTLRDSVGMADSGQFNYHLDRLTGHFVRKGEEGYRLRRPGERVVEAILSGAVTEAPVLERTELDFPCHFCGAPVAVRFREERVELFCTDCSGAYAETSDARCRSDSAAEPGYLGCYPLPPAGVAGREPEAVLRAAWTWGHLELLSAAAGVCPRCSAALDRTTWVCSSHESGDGLCSSCDRRYAVGVTLDCSNCIYAESGAAVAGLACAPELVAFLLDHGLDPFDPTDETFAALSRTYNGFEEVVVSVDPLRARFTFAADGDELVLSVDEDLRVTDAQRH